MGIKPKDLIGIPWRVAFALQADGWYLRKDIIWHKNNPMPESVTDRCTSSHEHIFHLTKSARYFYDNEAVKEPASRGRDYSKENRPIGGRKHRVSEGDINSRGGTGQYDRDWDSKDYGWAGTTRNRRDVWTISTKPYRGAHFATFPPKIPEICIKAGTSERGCCPVCGAPWVRVVERVPTYDNRPSPMERVRPCRGWGGLNATGSHNQTGTASQTLGFSPSCSCDAGEPVPCTVLDPFAGSGTTGAVAKSLGRDYILIEANPAYIPLIEARLAETKAPPRTTLEDF